MPENSYTLFQICAHLRRIKHVGICRYRRIENCTKSWNWGRRGGAAACKIKMPEEMVCIALELSGTGSRGVEIEGSEGNSGSPGLKYVCIRYRRIQEGKQVHLQLI